MWTCWGTTARGRWSGLGAPKKVTLPAEALPRLEGHFAKKSAVMRRELLGYLAGLPAEAALASARRLCGSADKLQKEAGVDLLKLLTQKGVDAAGVAEGMGVKAVPRYPAVRALGLYEEADRIRPIQPRKRKMVLMSAAARDASSGSTRTCMNTGRWRPAGRTSPWWERTIFLYRSIRKWRSHVRSCWRFRPGAGRGPALRDRGRDGVGAGGA